MTKPSGRWPATHASLVDDDLVVAVCDELVAAVWVVPPPHPANAVAATNASDRFHMTPTV
jgi:hypothetical protein